MENTGLSQYNALSQPSSFLTKVNKSKSPDRSSSAPLKPTVIDLVADDEPAKYPVRLHLIPFESNRVWWMFTFIATEEGSPDVIFLFDPSSVPEPKEIYRIVRKYPRLCMAMSRIWDDSATSDDHALIKTSGLVGEWCWFFPILRFNTLESDIVKSSQHFLLFYQPSPAGEGMDVEEKPII